MQKQVDMVTREILKPFKGEFLGQLTEGCVELIEAQVQERVGSYLKSRGMIQDDVIDLVKREALDTRNLSVALWRIERAVRELDALLKEGVSMEMLTERLSVALRTYEFNLEVEVFLNCVSSLLRTK